MAHEAQIRFVNLIKNNYSDFFIDMVVLDVGSLHINGNNRSLFEDCKYIGLDIGLGSNVDVVCPIHEYKPDERSLFDVVISTNMLEHDKHWEKSLPVMVRLLRAGGLLLISCAAPGSLEHGTKKVHPQSSPYTNDYYRGVSEEMFIKHVKREHFSPYTLLFNTSPRDLYFVGIKKLFDDQS